MSAYAELVDRFLEGSETPGEAEELLRRIRESDDAARGLYNRIMLEVDLYESYAGISELRLVPLRRRWKFHQLPVAIAVAVFFVIGLLALLFGGRPAPEAPRSPAPAASPEPKPPAPEPPKAAVPKPAIREGSREEHPEGREHEEREKRGGEAKRAEIEREFQKGMREVERKRLEGKQGEADKKLREIEREREKQLREVERGREHD